MADNDHFVTWWLGVITVLFALAFALAFQQIDSHFATETRHARELVIQQGALDCAQTKARWNESRTVAVTLTKPFPGGSAAVNAALAVRRQQTLDVLGPLPKC